MNAATVAGEIVIRAWRTENDLGSLVPFTIFGEPHMGGTLEANPKFAGKVSSSSEFICIFKDSYWIVSDQKLENSSV
jgi:hypothetical protein